MMPVDGAAVKNGQDRQQLQKRGLLFWRSCVGWAAVSVKPADVGNADAVGVVAVTMGAGLARGPALLYRAIEFYEVVVPAALPALGLMPFCYLCYIYVHSLRGGGAVQDNVVDKSHFGGTFSNVRKGTKDFPQTKRGVTLDLRHGVSDFNK